MKVNPVGRPPSDEETTEKAIGIKLTASDHSRLHKFRNRTGRALGTFIKELTFAALDQYDKGVPVEEVLARISNQTTPPKSTSMNTITFAVSKPVYRKLVALADKLHSPNPNELTKEMMIAASYDTTATQQLLFGGAIDDAVQEVTKNEAAATKRRVKKVA